MVTLRNVHKLPASIDPGHIIALDTHPTGATVAHLSGGQSILLEGPVDQVSKCLDVPFETLKESDQRMKELAEKEAQEGNG